MITCSNINQYMNGNRCPTPESLGECAAITTRHAVGSFSAYYTAHLYLWKAAENLTSAEVAKWFTHLGAKDITVSAVLHDPDNGIINGRHENDGVRPWDVSYFIANKESHVDCGECPRTDGCLGDCMKAGAA